ncbi:hypothetical protein TRICI_005072 [Trichomonascus ciferrii]|uniref:B30.2/SPRY domain-containing protein n=1 Tax=Trichomonascus ciferrii TaxID=44093 RepID=A0A642UW79_9ASCO|nr:hypothetical protein TRICI_005072 [Trichomonascus ciferrii]
MDDLPTAKRRRKEKEPTNLRSFDPPPRLRPPEYQAHDFTVVPQPPGMQSVMESDAGPLYSTEEYAYNKRGYRFVPCVPRPSMNALKYTAAEAPPFQARMSYEDRNKTHMLLSADATVISTQAGFRSARANVFVNEGTWYYEVKILRGNDSELGDAHIRAGFTRREATMEGPVGCDGYGYGIRDVGGDKVHLSRPKKFMDESFKTGDVIGFEITIPHRSSYTPNYFRDRYPIRYKGHLFFEVLDYTPTKPMDELLTPLSVLKKKREGIDHFHPQTIPDSYIRVYKNGKDMGNAFEDLYEFLPPASKFNTPFDKRTFDDGQLGYYPTVSVFKGGVAKVNFGPDFDYPPKNKLIRPICERYDEQIGEDVALDVIDQVDFEIQDAKEQPALTKSHQQIEQRPETTPAVDA